jgi:hypothetical protein
MHNFCGPDSHSLAFPTSLPNGTNFGTADRMSGSGYQEAPSGTHSDSEQGDWWERLVVTKHKLFYNAQYKIKFRKSVSI